MTKAAAAVLSSVWVPYFTGKGKAFQAEANKVTRVRGGYVVAGTRGHGTYDVTETGAGLACSCKGFTKQSFDGRHYCRHLIAVAFALVEIEEIRAEATEDKPAVAQVIELRPLSRRASVPMVVDMDPFAGAA